MRIDNARLLELLGEEPRTEQVAAMRATLEGLGCATRGSAEGQAKAPIRA